MDKPLAVLHVIPTMEGGGAERQLAYLAAGLTKKGINVHVALLRGGANMARLEQAGATVHVIPHLRNGDPQILRRIVGIIRKVRPDVIQSWITQMDVFSGLAAWWTGTPLVMTERASALAYGPGWKNWLRRRMGRRATMVVANSEAGAAYWRPVVGPDRVRVVRNASPLQEIAASAPLDLRSEGFSESTELVVYLGRYAPQKNLDVLLQALAGVLSSRSAAIAVLHGEGPLAPQLRAAAARLAPDGRVRVGGFTGDAWSLLKSAAVFVSISLFEGTPNTVLEAAACRCPLVLSDIPEHRELFDEDSAWLVRADSAELVQRAIESAICARTEAQRRASRALERVSRYSIEDMTGQYLDLYRSILARTA